MKRKCDAVLSVLITVPIVLLYWKYAVTGQKGDILSMADSGNVICYIMMIILFLAAYFSSFYIMERVSYQTLIPYTTGRLLFMALFLLLLCGTYSLWEKVLAQYVGIPWLTGGVSAGAMLLTLAICYMLHWHREKRKFSWKRIVTFGAILWGVAAAAFNTYSAVDVYKQYNLHHTSAYIDSIYNVLRGIPFQGGLTEQYGHYGLFFLPFRLTGINTKMIGMIMGILSAAVFTLCMTAFCRVIRSEIMCILVVISATMLHVSYMAERIYWQTFPHRLLFPALTLFFVSLYVQKGLTVRRYIITSSVMMLGVLWNLESGVVCTLAWCTYVAWDYIHNMHEIRWQAVMKMILVLVGEIMFSFMGAFAIVQIYNLLCGGRCISLIKFIGAVVDVSYMKSLTTPLYWGNYIYIHKMLFFLFCFAIAVLQIKSLKEREKYERVTVMLLITILGLGMMTYFINRPEAGERIIDLFAILLFGFWGEEAGAVWECTDKSSKVSLYKICRILIGLYAVMLLLVCAGAGGQCYHNMKEKIQKDAYDYEDFRKFTAEIRKEIPKDTWAKGEGSTAIYMELGWDKKTRDFDDFTSEDQKTISEQSNILITEAYYDNVPEGFQLIREYSYHGIVYGYYCRQ